MPTLQDSRLDDSAAVQPQSHVRRDAERRPVGGAFAPVADHDLGIWGLLRSGVCDSRIACLGPGRKGMGSRLWEEMLGA
jgi:hypothetical protein